MGNLEFLNDRIGQNLVQELMNPVISKDEGKTVLYPVERLVFQSLLNTISKRTLPKSLSKSYNRIKEGQMLWLDVEY